MKSLATIQEKLQSYFGPEGKGKHFHPLYEAIDSFILSSAARTGSAPHIRDPLDLKRLMTIVVVAMLPCTLAAVYFIGLRVLAVILVSYTAGGLCEVLFGIIRKEKINEGFLVTGLAFALTLPPMLPLWMVALGAMFGVVIGKEIFGGTGRNIFNPAIAGRCFLAISYPAAMSSGWVLPGTGATGRLFHYVTASTVDAVTKATPLGLLKQGVPTDALSLFTGNHAGCIGETWGLGIIAGGLFLLWTRVANWRIVFSLLLSVFAFAGILHHLNPHSFAPPLFHIGAGGLLLGAFFMATDPVTSSATNAGRWFYGAIIGIVTVLIRNFSGYVEGVMFAILIGNTVAPLIDEIVYKIQLNRLAHET